MIELPVLEFENLGEVNNVGSDNRHVYKAPWRMDVGDTS